MALLAFMLSCCLVLVMSSKFCGNYTTICTFWQGRARSEELALWETSCLRSRRAKVTLLTYRIGLASFYWMSQTNQSHF